MDTIDLRSDTVSWPTEAMREAMAKAHVGDDVWGDDPTVNHLQSMAAEMTGKEAALFVPSGTMGNLTASLSHCDRGDEVILGNQAHVFRYEAGGMAALGGIQPFTVPNQPDGTLNLSDVEDAIRSDDAHFPRTRAIFVENTHNICGGAVIPPDYFVQLEALADRYGLIVHLDGARVFNAAVALNCAVTDITHHVDSVTFCLSKGLCCPVGSLLCGSTNLIARAKRVRKVLGGGMRQAGILAAAGIIALDQMVDRLADDHQNARKLAEGLNQIPGIRIDLDRVQSNLVFFELTEDTPIEPQVLLDRLDQQYNVKIGGRGGRAFRACTHYWITEESIDLVLLAIQDTIGRYTPEWTTA